MGFIPSWGQEAFKLNLTTNTLKITQQAYDCYHTQHHTTSLWLLSHSTLQTSTISSHSHKLISFHHTTQWSATQTQAMACLISKVWKSFEKESFLGTFFQLKYHILLYNKIHIFSFTQTFHILLPMHFTYFHTNISHTFTQTFRKKLSDMFQKNT